MKPFCSHPQLDLFQEFHGNFISGTHIGGQQYESVL